MPQNESELVTKLVNLGLSQLGFRQRINTPPRRNQDGVHRHYVSDCGRALGYVLVNLKSGTIIGERYDDESHLRATFKVQGENIILTPD